MNMANNVSGMLTAQGDASAAARMAQGASGGTRRIKLRRCTWAGKHHHQRDQLGRLGEALMRSLVRLED